MTLSGWGSETYIGDYGVEWNVMAKGVTGIINILQFFLQAQTTYNKLWK